QPAAAAAGRPRRPAPPACGSPRLRQPAAAPAPPRRCAGAAMGLEAGLSSPRGGRKRRAALKRRSHASPPVIGMRVAMTVGVKMGTGMIVPVTCALAMRSGVGVIDAAQRAALAPDAVAVLVMLLLPDRAGVLHLLDQLAAGAEGLVAVRGTRGHHHRQVAHAEASPGMRDVQPDLRSEARIDLFG